MINTNNLFKDKKAQISVEILLIVGIVVLAAILVGYYLKQISYKNSQKVQQYKEAATAGND